MQVMLLLSSEIIIAEAGVATVPIMITDVIIVVSKRKISPLVTV